MRVIELAAARLLERLQLTPAALVQSESCCCATLQPTAARRPEPGHFEHELTSGFERVLSGLAELARWASGSARP